MPKMIEVTCSEQIKTIITTAIATYAELAYPKASKSECNQASRESLMTAVEQFEQHYQEHGTGVLSRRIRAMVKAAIETRYLMLEEEKGKAHSHQRELLLAICKGEPGTDDMLAEAIEKDNVG